ncbi:hypothetical protein BU24DRAFT_424923 [Aaosphaeria arxii CBS 175.79]|uniref:Uncharacterized protein n=1 Tax=Aaosphaeria arxii CBS 175.79 TaxID=1450172 RepID=A0A6A5XM53_9PLEO|nr:uncharacterized protein BU24DRAFT_424923 [Aaosphaeria arxii CBS 175.79]KAF2013891.1 hypothetical protein BU24DRAFT_424923 [Aaosphaeria arxii CBS 175.79]
MPIAIEHPLSFEPAHVYPTEDCISPDMDMSHLSGATMADLTAAYTEPKIQVISASPNGSKHSTKSRMSSNRCSVASTTKSELRRSNHLLIEMLQNIQAELTTHRTILLDVQHRVTHLENESVASLHDDEPLISALQRLEGRASKRNSTMVPPPESQSWWQACQNFAHNSDTPMSANEFLKTPVRFSGLGWEYGVPTRPHTPPLSPPEVDDIPALTPTSEHEEHSDDDTPRKLQHKDNDAVVSEVRSATPHITEGNDDYDVKEHTVEVDKRNMPPPPNILPAPAGKSVAAVEDRPAINPHRYFRGVRSLATYKAVMKNRSTDKEHHVLIHFHKRGELKDREEHTA